LRLYMSFNYITMVLIKDRKEAKMKIADEMILENETLGKINGFLKAFEWMNHKLNHQYWFFVKDYKKCSVDEALEQYKHSFKNPEKIIVENSEVNSELFNLHYDLYDLFDDLLFAFQKDDNGKDFLIDERFSSFFQDEEGRAEIIKELISWLEIMMYGFECLDNPDKFYELVESGELKVYSVNANADNSYDLVYDDILLVGKNKTLLIHLGYSD